MKIDVALDLSLLNAGTRHLHQIDFTRTPHIMTVGASGSGKTHLNKLIIARTALKIPDAKITLLDVKADDYHMVRGSPRLYEFDAVKKGLEAYYAEFLCRQQGKDSDRSFRLLAIEELGSMLGFYDKRESDEIKSKLASLIFLGRSFNIHCLVSTQRPDASYFNSGVRDSIGFVIALGNLSKEGKSMVFPGFHDDMLPVSGCGSGYMLTNSTNLRPITVPSVGDVDKLHHYIREAVSR